MLAPLALALFLITSNVRWALNSPSLHTALFERHSVSERTGIATADLESVARQVEEYLTTDKEPLEVLAEVRGVERSLFSLRETEHLADVKGLFDLTFRVQEAAALFCCSSPAPPPTATAGIRGGCWEAGRGVARC